jgi:peptide/nickel transport system permease protein
MLAIFAPIIAPNDPNKIDVKNSFLESSEEFPLGTDQLGRCIYSRLLFGARTSLTVTCLVLMVTITIGTVIGTISGIFSGRLIDKMLTALCEILLAFPGILFALVVAGMLGPGIFNIMLAIALISWAKYARVIRGLVIGVKNADYIKAARVSGTNNFHLITWHILPNIKNTIGTIIVTDIGSTILTISGLSFIGLGAQATEAEWGMMINEARIYIDKAPQMILYPVITIVICVLAFNLIGDSLGSYEELEGI